MRKIAVVIIALMCSMSIWAKDYIPTKEVIGKFLKTKTLVVMEPNQLSEYNFRIKGIIEKHWDLTDYDFISVKEFEEKRKDSKFSFLMVTEVKFENDKTYSKYNFLSLLMGGDYEQLDEMPDLCPVPLSYAKVVEGNYVYKVGALIRFMQNHVRSIYKNPDLISGSVFKHYNKNMGDVQTKTLYVVKEELEKKINTVSKFKKVYPFKFKFVTRDEIEKAIDEDRDDIVFLHKVGPEGSKLKARVYKILIGCGDQQFYYFDYHMFNSSKRPDGLLSSDLKKMAKKKRKK